MKNNRLIIIIVMFLGGLVLIIISFLLWQNYSTSTFIVSAPQNSKILVKQDSNDFKEIGTTKATFKTQSRSVVIFEARLNDQVSQKSFTPQINKTKNVNMEFQALKTAQLFANVALTNILIENGFIYGINVNTNTLTAAPINPSNATAPTVPLLPFLKQIIWKNSTNFYAVTLGRGTQIIENKTILDGNLLPISSIAVGKSNSIVLANDGYYLSESNNLNKLKKLSGIVENTQPLVFADKNYLYSLNQFFNKATSDDDTPSIKETQILVYDQQGQQKYDLKVDIKENVYKVLSIDTNTIAVLTNNQLVFIDLNSKKLQVQDFSFGLVRDMVLYNNKLLLLGSDGLWEYNQGSSSYSKIATYPPTQQYAPNSLTVYDNTLFFSTTATNQAIKDKTGPTVVNGTYKISL